MNNAAFRKNIGIIFGNAIALAGIVGWWWFVWALCGNSLNFWEKILAEAIMYLLIISLSYACARGMGVVPVRVVYIEKGQSGL